MRKQERLSRIAIAVMLAAVWLTASPTGNAQNGSIQFAQPEKFVYAGAEQGASYSLDDLIGIGLQANPALQKAGLEINAAGGRALQAGLYPNPQVTISGEEIGSNGGIHVLPQIKQEIVTADKLKLNRAVAARAVDQAQLALVQQRFQLFAGVRQGFYELLGLQGRIDTLQEQVKIADQSYQNAEKLRKGKQIAELDVLPFEVQLEELKADLAAAQQEYNATWQKFVSEIGAPQLPPRPLDGSLFTPLPDYDMKAAQVALLQRHPAIQSAEVGISKAQIALRRAEVQRIPNVTLAAGYQRNFNENVHQGTYGVQIPIPLFDRNQGNVIAAKAELGQAIFQKRNVENTLLKQLAAAFGRYAAAKARAERYRTYILPKAQRAYELSLQAFKGGQFEYLRVIQTQQALNKSNLLYIQSLSKAWQAAGEISGLLLQEQWPPQVLPGARLGLPEVDG